MRNQLFSAITAARTTPSPTILEDAPILRDWMAALDPHGMLCLMGTIAGHPNVADSKTACTSLLLALDPGVAGLAVLNEIMPDWIIALLAFFAALFPALANGLKIQTSVEEITRLAAEFKNLQNRFRFLSRINAPSPRRWMP